MPAAPRPGHLSQVQRISLQQIRQHPWFLLNLPRECQVRGAPPLLTPLLPPLLLLRGRPACAAMHSVHANKHPSARPWRRRPRLQGAGELLQCDPPQQGEPEILAIIQAARVPGAAAVQQQVRQGLGKAGRQLLLCASC